MEFVLGGLAACGAGLFTNPLEVAKTRMQLQGELRARGHYAVHYRNVVHAFFNVARYEGILALQKGLTPALWYQFVMNGIRMGTYQSLVNLGLTKTKEGDVSTPRNVLAGATAGCLSAGIASPLYMIKTQLQAEAAASIAVGHQHHHASMRSAFYKIYHQYGVKGLWRGVSASIPRVAVGSASQLTTFSKSKEFINSLHIFEQDSILSAFCASCISGLVLALTTTPFDVVSTRIYNQGTDASGKGLMYSNVVDCFVKIFRKEGPFGFYKGWTAALFRFAPHTILHLVFWNEIRKLYYSFVPSTHL